MPLYFFKFEIALDFESGYFHVRVFNIIFLNVLCSVELKNKDINQILISARFELAEL